MEAPTADDSGSCCFCRLSDGGSKELLMMEMNNVMYWVQNWGVSHIIVQGSWCTNKAGMKIVISAQDTI